MNVQNSGNFINCLNKGGCNLSQRSGLTMATTKMIIFLAGRSDRLGYLNLNIFFSKWSQESKKQDGTIGECLQLDIYMWGTKM